MALVSWTPEAGFPHGRAVFCLTHQKERQRASKLEALMSEQPSGWPQPWLTPDGSPRREAETLGLVLLTSNCRVLISFFLPEGLLGLLPLGSNPQPHSASSQGRGITTTFSQKRSKANGCCESHEQWEPCCSLGFSVWEWLGFLNLSTPREINIFWCINML